MPSPTASSSTSLVSPSTSLVINALVAGDKWGGPVGTGTTVSYSFPWQAGAGATYAGYGGFGNYSMLNEPGATQHYGLDPVQKAAFQQALQSWANVANLSFNPLPDNATTVGDIRVAFTSASTLTSTGQAAWGWAYEPDSGSPSSGDIWLNTASMAANGSGWGAGSQNYASLLHEIGHSLGLKHPFENGVVLPAVQATQQYSVMAYTPPARSLYVAVTNSVSTWWWSAYNIEPSTPMVYDILALQHLYGANTSYHAGDTTYTFDPATPFIETLWDAGGTDTISAANFTLGCTIDLRQGHFSTLAMAAGPSAPAGLNWAVPPPVSTYDGTDNLAIAFGCVIENATGGSADDTLQGNDASNVLNGGAGNDVLIGEGGNDTLDGGAGLDTAVFSARLAAFNRTPDLAGLGGWIAAMDGGAPLLQVATSFIGSAESQNRYGPAPDNAQFITALYLNVLSRAPDAGGYGYWVNQLASGLQTRPQVLLTFSESAENKAALLPLIAGGIVYTTAAQAAGPAKGQNLAGTAGDDILTGSVGKDIFTPGAGNDSVNGGAGIDLAVYSGSRASHAIATSTGSLSSTISLTVTGGSNGTDTLVNVERLKFEGAFKSVGRYFKRPCHSNSDPIGDWRGLSEG